MKDLAVFFFSMQVQEDAPPIGLERPFHYRREKQEIIERKCRDFV